jgi:hypothetical protein
MFSIKARAAVRESGGIGRRTRLKDLNKPILPVFGFSALFSAK